MERLCEKERSHMMVLECIINEKVKIKVQTEEQWTKILVLICRKFSNTMHATTTTVCFSTTLSIARSAHCVISLLIPFEEDVCTFLIFSYSFIGQQLLLKQFCSNCLSFKDSLLTSTANPAQRGRTGCAG